MPGETEEGSEVKHDIASWRGRLGVTQAEVARLAKLPPTKVSLVEHAMRHLPAVKAVLMALEERRRESRLSEEKAAAVEQAWAEGGETDAAQIAKQAMLEMAWKLLDSGMTDLADELLESLPRADAMQLLDEFFDADTPGEDSQ